MEGRRFLSVLIFSMLLNSHVDSQNMQSTTQATATTQRPTATHTPITMQPVTTTQKPTTTPSPATMKPTTPAPTSAPPPETFVTISFRDSSMRWPHLMSVVGKVDDISSKSVQYYKDYINSGVDMTSLDCDPYSKSLYYGDSNFRTIYKMDHFHGMMNDTQSKTVKIHQGYSGTASSIAIDWINDNLFIADHQFNWIAVQSTSTNDSSMWRVLIHELTYPSQIAIDPHNGLMFWFDMPGLKPVIWRADLSGKNQFDVKTGAYVQAMEVDYREQRVYYTDGNAINSFDYSGMVPRTHVRRTMSYHFSDLVIGQDGLCSLDEYWGDFECFEKVKEDFPNGQSTYYEIFYTNQPLAMANCDKELLVNDLSDACKNNPCEHICVPTSGTNGRCLCKEGYQLNPDGKTCKADHYLFGKGILISNDTHICMSEVRTLTGNNLDIICLRGNFSNTRHLAADANTHNVMFLNVTSSELIVHNIQSGATFPLAKTSSNVAGIAYDHTNQNLYWSDDTGKIRVVNVVTQQLTVLFADIENLGPITVAPGIALLWISSKNNEYSIYNGSLDGSSQKVVVPPSKLSKPTALFYEQRPNRIFFLDKDKLTSCFLDGSELATSYTYAEGTDLIIYGRFSLWISSSDDILYATSYNSFSTDEAVHTKEFGKPRGIAIYDKSKQLVVKGHCWLENGGCEEFCIEVQNSYKCKCQFGLKLETQENKKCFSVPLGTNFLLVTDVQHNKLYQVDLADPTNIILLEIPKEIYPSSAVYHQVQDKLYIADSTKDVIYWMHMDGTNATMAVDFHSVGLIPIRMAIDYTTGNLYYSAYKADKFGDGIIGVYQPKRGYHATVLDDLYEPRGLAIYPKKGLMFVAESGVFFGSAITKVAMSGKSPKQIVTDDIRAPFGLVVDYETDRIFWADSTLDVIDSSNFDGGERKILKKIENTYYTDLAIGGSYIYAVGVAWDKVDKLHKETGEEADLMVRTPEFGSLQAITIVPGETQEPNKRCSEKNGDCSTFCLPEPAGQAKCGCEDGAILLGDGYSCDNDVAVCDNKVLYGELKFNTDCHAIEGYTCPYTCIEGYRPIEKPTKVDKVTCLSTGNWTTPLDKLCERIQCPKDITNGKAKDDCTLQTGDICSYSCNDGYVKNPSIPIIGCTKQGRWDHSHDMLCQKEVSCLEQIDHGTLANNCRYSSSSCPVKCEKNYMQHSAVRSVHCLADGTLSVDPKKVCQPIQCGLDVMNGQFEASCTGLGGSACKYTCDEGYQAKGQTIAVCSAIGDTATWSIPPDHMCKKKECPFSSPGATLITKDPAVVGESYNFTCSGNRIRLDDVLLLTCSMKGAWNVKLNSLCKEPVIATLPPPAKQTSVEQPALIGTGVAIAVCVLIIVILIAILVIANRRKSTNMDISASDSGRFVDAPNVRFTNPTAEIGGVSNPYTSTEQPKNPTYDNIVEKGEIAPPRTTINGENAYSKF